MKLGTPSTLGTSSVGIFSNHTSKSSSSADSVARWPGQGHFSTEFLMVHPSKKWLYMSDNSNMFVLEHNGGHFMI